MNPSRPVEWWRPDFSEHGPYERGISAAAKTGVQDSPVAFWALMTFTFILLLAPQRFFPALASMRIALLTAVVAAAAYLVDRLVRSKPVSVFTREMGLVACLVGWAILTIPFSYWPGGSVQFLLDIYFKSLVIFWLLSNTVNSTERMHRVFWALSLMSVPLAATGVENFVSGVFLLQGKKRIVGYDAPLTGNPNDLALMLNLILPLSMALFAFHRRARVRLFSLGIILLNVAAVILTFSRAGFLTLVTVLVMSLWKFFGRLERGWAVVFLGLFLLGLPLLPSGYWDRLATITEVESDPTGSSQQRWKDMVAAASFVLKNPIIGAGVGQNILALNVERGRDWVAVHNVYLEYAVELGIVGLVLFIMLLKRCIQNVSEVQRHSSLVPALRDLYLLAEGIKISLIAFAVSAMFYPVGYHFYFYYFAGLAVAIKAVHESEKQLWATQTESSS